MALSYGSEGIKQKDYQVYIGKYTVLLRLLLIIHWNTK